MKICSVIVTYNRKKLLEECINSLLSQTYKLDKILIIDNNSSDGTEAFIKKNYLNVSVIEYHKLNENIGGAGGFSYGVKECMKESYDWVWIMDDDTIPNNNALENLIDSLDIIKEDKISFLASNVRGVHDEIMNVPNISNKKDDNGYMKWIKYLEHSIVEIDRATFVSVLINTKAIKELGYPWKEFFIWGDDTEYTLRLSKLWGPGYSIGKSVAVHKRGCAKEISIFTEKNENRIKLYKYKYRNDILISKEYYGKKSILKCYINSIKDAFKCINSNKGFAKFNMIIGSVINVSFNFRIWKKFKNRMEIE